MIKATGSQYVHRKLSFLLAGLVLLGLLGLLACSDRQDLAPVTELAWRPNAQSQAQYHIVHRGETLFSVAFLYDQDYQTLARYNHLSAPYSIRVGQKLRLIPQVKISSSASAPLPARIRNKFIWPVHGRVIRHYQPMLRQKGIDVAVDHDGLVRASAAGQVAYAGPALVGYGYLMIIDHHNGFLTAYSNNSKCRVKEGQTVQQNQVIGETGALDRHHRGIHFELRKAGLPVNPLLYLTHR